MPDVPFAWRVAALIGVAALFVLLDRRKPAAQRTRAGEYTFLFVMGLAGALFGAVNDWITSTLSPEYFIFGKGLDAGSNLTIDVLQLGGQAGFTAGVVGAAVVLYFTGGAISASRLYRLAPVPFLAATLTGAILGIVNWLTGGIHGFANLDGFLTPEQTERFHIVWSVHLGIYIGAALALIGVIGYVRRDWICAAPTTP